MKSGKLWLALCMAVICYFYFAGDVFAQAHSGGPCHVQMRAMRPGDDIRIYSEVDTAFRQFYPHVALDPAAPNPHVDYYSPPEPQPPESIRNMFAPSVRVHDRVRYDIWSLTRFVDVEDPSPEESAEGEGSRYTTAGIDVSYVQTHSENGGYQLGLNLHRLIDECRIGFAFVKLNTAGSGTGRTEEEARAQTADTFHQIIAAERAAYEDGAPRVAILPYVWVGGMSRSRVDVAEMVRNNHNGADFRLDDGDSAIGECDPSPTNLELCTAELSESWFDAVSDARNLGISLANEYYVRHGDTLKAMYEREYSSSEVAYRESGLLARLIAIDFEEDPRQRYNFDRAAFLHYVTLWCEKVGSFVDHLNMKLGNDQIGLQPVLYARRDFAVAIRDATRHPAAGNLNEGCHSAQNWPIWLAGYNWFSAYSLGSSYVGDLGNVHGTPIVEDLQKVCAHFLQMCIAEQYSQYGNIGISDRHVKDGVPAFHLDLDRSFALRLVEGQITRADQDPRLLEDNIPAIVPNQEDEENVCPPEQNCSSCVSGFCGSAILYVAFIVVVLLALAFFAVVVLLRSRRGKVRSISNTSDPEQE